MKPENKARRDALKRLDNLPRRKGLKDYRKFLEGGKLTLKQAVLCKCLECTCFFADGQKNCLTYTCPLYDFQPFPPETIEC